MKPNPAFLHFSFNAEKGGRELELIPKNICCEREFSLSVTLRQGWVAAVLTGFENSNKTPELQSSSIWAWIWQYADKGACLAASCPCSLLFADFCKYWMYVGLADRALGKLSKTPLGVAAWVCWYPSGFPHAETCATRCCLVLGWFLDGYHHVQDTESSTPCVTAAGSRRTCQQRVPPVPGEQGWPRGVGQRHSVPGGCSSRAQCLLLGLTSPAFCATSPGWKAESGRRNEWNENVWLLNELDPR